MDWDGHGVERSRCSFHQVSYAHFVRYNPRAKPHQLTSRSLEHINIVTETAHQQRCSQPAYRATHDGYMERVAVGLA